MPTAADLCRDRTDCGNAYPTPQQAQGYARLVHEVAGVQAEAYLCPVCGKWHVRRVGPELRIVG